MKRFNLQLFAEFDKIAEENAQAFEGSTHKENFTALSAKLGELGYDVLINNKKSAEFVPASRLNDVVSQRDGFKTQLETSNQQLEVLKKAAGDNEQLKGEYQKMIDQNNGLLEELKTASIKLQIAIAAKDAINPQDLFMFINMGNIKINSKGEVLGADSEIARLKQEKPYLFNAADGKKKKGGTDPEDDKTKLVTGNMNSMIRRAAGIN